MRCILIPVNKNLSHYEKFLLPKRTPRWVPFFFWSRVRESICIFAEGENYGSPQCLHWGQALSTGQCLCDRFDSRPIHKKRKAPGGYLSFFGAGYGNRTRLHGLGSRCITDIRTLHSIVHIIADLIGNFNTFLSTASLSHPLFFPFLHKKRSFLRKTPIWKEIMFAFFLLIWYAFNDCELINSP